MDAIKMKSTRQGSPTGATVETFEEGQVYVIGETITESLAQTFLDAKWAGKTKVKSAEEIAAEAKAKAEEEAKAKAKEEPDAKAKEEADAKDKTKGGK